MIINNSKFFYGVKKIVPSFLFLFYHRVLALSAALFYGFPGQKMIVIGVTGTTGKSTTANLIAKILEQAGFKVGLATTFNFKIRNKEWENKTKMTMLGRFALQKLLKQMLKAGCSYVVIETSSQGVIQYRHLGLNYDIGVFTNLSPEHIEAHGGFVKYREAKQKFFQHLSKSKRKKLNDKLIDKISIINLDDDNQEHFLKFKTDQQYGYTIKNLKFFAESETADLRGKNQSASSADKPVSSRLSGGQAPDLPMRQEIKIVEAKEIKLTSQGSEFIINGINFKLNLLGKFNISNALAAVNVALSQGVSLDVCKRALTEVKQMPGRMEIIAKEPFILVDYAHTPNSLEKVYQTIKNLDKRGKLICVFGSAGGGRDKWKRPIMGEIAEKYCDEIIVTNEDPYDEEPEEIIAQVIAGIKNKKAIKIIDRKKAITQALSIAEKEDTIIITGKGCEPCIMGPKGKRFLWDDRKAVRELLT
jgi:UDP-N-acetylmuramoyl-L-alanyl-D-glutamate--2,6-diaminopimelate ligase